MKAPIHGLNHYLKGVRNRDIPELLNSGTLAAGGDSPQADFTAALKDLVNREVALEDKVP